ncbi:RE1-silencing transcription factor [Syngnathus acus]|uniref:RE1-silencing transcription factor n=1 Tax=Syngnathus acus TaxID=161584 RepID=UPI00188608DD|nr:RE1-silencing transcription factor [Syngnathus acus]
MAAASVFSMEPFPLMDDDIRSSPAPQLVMLANVAAVAAADAAEGSVADDKEMMELQTVPCGYSDNDDEGTISYDYDNSDGADDIVDFPESSGLVQNGGRNASCEIPPPNSSGPSPPLSPPRREAATPVPANGGKKKKPFHCKPCHFLAHDEKDFVEHLRTHAVSKMVVVNHVEGRSKAKAKEADTAEEGEAEAASGDAKGLIRCERCGYNTNRYDHYVAHLKHHNKEGDDNRVFKCTLCAYSTVSQYHWRKHLRNHFPSKLHTCTYCSYFTDRKSNYIQHIRTHTGVRPFRCPYCDYSSSQKTHLTRHMRTHSGERPFKCDSCNYLAANQHEVTRHARQVHNGPKPLACPYCEYKTADRSNFKKHVELHLNPRQFLCPLCKYAASKKCNLQYHIKSRHLGCNVAVDVSKVKLRVKKPNQPSKANPSNVEEDINDREVKEEQPPGDKPSGPINLSLAKSAKAAPGDKEPEESPRKRHGSAENGEQEKTITTRQKKPKEKPEETANATKAKRRVKKMTDDGPHDPQLIKDQREKSQAAETTAQRDGNKIRKPRRSGKSEQEELAGSIGVPEGLQEDGKEKSKKSKTAQALDLSLLPPSKARRTRTGDSLQSSSPAKRARRSNRKSSPPPAKGRSGTPDVPEKSAQPEQPTPVQVVSPPVEPSERAENTQPAPAPPAEPASVPPAPLPKRCGKASDPDDDDEGVHSSHEGSGGDVSDGASEGSDDSGLNGNVAGKNPDNPETPTCEVPTPTELKSHMCIFCDRYFSKEAEYRRHLNRHLVNVYYMDAAPASN